MTMPRFSTFDHHMMGIALALVARGLGRTAPNPAVGAVIADETSGEVIARGWTQPGGRPHAETEAIARADSRARGATMYVTLEPCSHHGKTPPCAEAIVAAGIARVVAAIEDPDPRVAGRGLERLRRAGIAAERGLLAREAHWLTRGHIVRVTERRPLVQLKLALDENGEVPRGKSGMPTLVTSEAARRRGHLLRAQADAILVGRGTVDDDNPMLDCRLPGMSSRSPLRVVLDAGLSLPPQSRLAETARRVPVLVFFAAGGDGGTAARAEALAMLGVETCEVPSVAGRLWLPAVLEALAARGLTRLLVEGGPAIWRSFCAAGLVDEVVLFHAGAVSAAAAQEHLARHVDGLPLERAQMARIGPDTLLACRTAAPRRRESGGGEGSTT